MTPSGSVRNNNDPSNSNDGSDLTVTPESTTPRRQNSISAKTQLSAKISEEKNVLDISPSPLETVVLEAEDLEKLHSHKSIKEKKSKLTKEMTETRKRHLKERQGIDLRLYFFFNTNYFAL